MSEQPETPEGKHHPEELPPVAEPDVVPAPASPPPPIVASPPPPILASPPPPIVPPSAAAAAVHDSNRPENTADRPEIKIGAAFAGGFLIALILKRLAR